MDMPAALAQDAQTKRQTNLNQANLEAASQARSQLNDQVLRSLKSYEWGSSPQPAPLPDITDPDVDGSNALAGLQKSLKEFGRTMAGGDG